MSKQTVSRHKTAVRHAHAARPRHHGKSAHRRNPIPKMTPPSTISAVEFNPAVIEVVEVDFLGDPDEAVADDAIVTGFEDEDL